MMQQEDKKIRLCKDCFKCKTKGKLIYCKLGVWREIKSNKTILYTPYDFNCNQWEDVE